MAKFDKKKLAEACDGLTNAFVNKLCNENLPKKPEDWVRLFETEDFLFFAQEQEGVSSDLRPTIPEENMKELYELKQQKC